MSRTDEISALLAVVLAGVLAAASPAVAAAAPESERPFATRQLLDCSGAISLPCGGSHAGSNIGAPRNVDYYADAPVLMNGGEVVYELVLPGPQYWMVDAVIVRDGNVDLFLFLLGSCDEDDLVLWTDIVFFSHPLPPGTYYLVVDGGTDGQGGYYEDDYTLEVECTAVDPPVPDCCPLVDECAFFDFRTTDTGFSTADCSGVPVWSWGNHPYWTAVDCDGAPAEYALATVPDGHYPSSAGEGAVIGPVAVSENCSCLELCHTYLIREGYDGGDVRVSDDGGATWDKVHPAGMYDSTTHWATLCVGNEIVFSGRVFEPARDCFDLSAYLGSEVLIGFFFGSSVDGETYGWYISWARLGSSGTPAEGTSWGTIKSMYR